MLKTISDILYSSLENLFVNQSRILEYTEETNITEWNLGHHLANEIKKYLFWLDNDVEVIKTNLENKRPDIIFHKRTCYSLDYLVIEIKRNEESGKSDIEKIEDFWMGNRLDYRYGAYINIDDNGDYNGCVFDQNGNKKDINREENNYVSPFCKMRLINEQASDLYNKVDEVCEVENRNKGWRAKNRVERIEGLWRELLEIDD
ncbi:hypothetical protein Halha_1489 [Halobacteroides halobius DSM 5150]|uniref:Type I restriction enzyme R protein N-terminal domain-containing protein n=1 Tax=Halobacteroides halobius (strain ATCC 35273 / DSM 5150 / MD-1) TaxID=748449 RepID=L0K8U5_HALHC|nr:hypothetical protein [Halobacteroides halobius]AGB41431.1 hypothetical protein Halha_1489 [Halobacteroides halobius DSM 5150]